MTAQEKQEIREQEQLDEFQGKPVRRPDGLPPDNLERYALFLKDQLYWDIHDQSM